MKNRRSGVLLRRLACYYENNITYVVLFCVYFRQLCYRGCYVGIGWDYVAHSAVVKLLVSHEVEVSGAGKAEHYGLFFACLLALEGFVDGYAYGVAALRCRLDAFHASKLLGCGKHRCLFHGAGFHESVVVELRQYGAHAVEAESSGVAG